MLLLWPGTAVCPRMTSQIPGGIHGCVGAQTPNTKQGKEEIKELVVTLLFLLTFTGGMRELKYDGYKSPDTEEVE